MEYRKQRVLGRLLCAAGVLLFYFAETACTYRDTAEESPKLTFSADSGFYSDAFPLEITASRGTIYYTLDSTDPDESSLRYIGPIEISDASLRENVYCMNTDVNLEFHPEILEAKSITLSYGYALPTEPVDKATVVRAVAVDADGEKSEIVTKVYFVGFDRKEAYTGMSVISIVTDPDNLFGYEKGIYVLGKTFEDGVISDPPQSLSQNYGWWLANYHQKGKNWERRADVSFFDGTERKEILSGQYGIRIQGGSSRGMLPKSLNLFAGAQYRSPAFEGSLLFENDRGEYGSITLSAGGHAAKTMLNDYLINSLSADLAIATREYRPCVLFLEGEYWGFYWLTQRYKEDYFVNQYGVDEDDIFDLKLLPDRSVEIGEESETELYDALLEYAAHTDLSVPENFAHMSELIDMESCVDYYADEIYIANLDWPNNNVQLWRTRSISDGKYGDGRWRWLLFDVNYACDPNHAEEDMVERTITLDPLFESLMKNEAFEQALYAKLLELAHNNYNPEKTDAFIDRYEEEMLPIMLLNYKRFYGENLSDETFLEGCEAVRAFFHRRYDYIVQTYGK